MNRCNYILLFVIVNFLPFPAGAQKFEVRSPHTKIRLSVEIGKTVTYSVGYLETNLISSSAIGMTFQSDPISEKDPVVSSSSKSSVNTKIIPAVKEKRAVIPDIYNELVIKFTDHREIQFRVYNDAVAYRFKTSLSGEVIVLNEEGTFNFQKGSLIYYPQVTRRADADIFHTSFEENYTTARLDTLSEDLIAFTPGCTTGTRSYGTTRQDSNCMG